jgi:MFS transporter, UMF1 family
MGNSGSQPLLRPGVTRREAFAWASLDFANSGYTTVVLTAIFNAYFVSTVMANEDAATFVWTLILSASFALVMVSAPIIGAYADLRARKRQLLILSTMGCVVATALLATVGPGAWVWAALLLVVSNFCYATNQDLVAAFLPEIARQERLGQVSGYGWGWGYLGGLFALGLSLVWVGVAQGQAMSAQAVVGGTMLATAGLFAVVALPSLLVLRERAAVAPNTDHWRPRDWLSASWGRLVQTWRNAESLVDLRRFLVCVLIYHAGVQTVITLAAVYAQQVMGFEIRQTIFLILIVNITAAIGAWGFGFFQDRLGHAKSLKLSLWAWVAMVFTAWLADTEAMFWLAANFAGLAMGASQSGARAAIAHLSRPGREAETFGLWGVAVNCSAILGPLTYGAVTWITGNSHRTAMLITGLFFVVGLVLLARIDFDRGRKAARPSEEETV